MEHCSQAKLFSSNESFCNGYWDSETLICWPATKVGTGVVQHCTLINGDHTGKTLAKYCTEDEEWVSSKYDAINSTNYVNYNACLTEEAVYIMQVLQSISQEEFEIKLAIAKFTRIFELIGLTASLLTLTISIVILSSFRSLKNPRTDVHINLFAAVYCTSFMKFVIYIEQLITKSELSSHKHSLLEKTPILCESAYILLEYSKSTIYTWMLIEALHLHRAVAVTAVSMSFKKSYLFFGWGCPAFFVVPWVLAMLLQQGNACWWGYNYNRLYWILESQRIIVLLINTFYLVSIIHSIFVKLHRNRSSDLEIIRKSTKATFMLLPLLGITNYVVYLEPRLDCTTWYFFVYSFSAYFVTSFQGVFISLLYCFLNHEVKALIFKKGDSNSSSRRGIQRSQLTTLTFETEC